MNPISPTAGLKELLVRLWRHLSRRHRLQLALVFTLMLVTALAEVVSLGTLLPFLGILVAPDLFISRHPWVGDAMTALGITSADQLIFPLTICFVSSALIAGAIRAFLLRTNTWLARTIGTDLSTSVYRRTLCQPYKVHLTRNSSQVISGISSKMNIVVIGVLQELLMLSSSILILTAIMVTLIAINPVVASVAAIGSGTCYGLIVIPARRHLKINSERIAYEQTRLIKVLQEGLGGIRDVLLNGVQSIYCDAYRKADYPMRKAFGNNLIISQTPRFVIEALGTATIAAFAYYFTSKDGIATALPVLGVMVVGAQRMLPALQHSYSAWSSIIGNQASLRDIIELLDQPIPEEMLEKQASLEPLSFHSSICFKDVWFRFSSDGPWVLEGFNLSISRGARIGFVGVSGSGKSTALDLLMGLLVPNKGELLVDGKLIGGNHVRRWQRQIAHVPQDIYLTDSTVSENIAFGVQPENINLERVRASARQAQIADFIESRSEGYNTLIGERGIRLSGGQQQRIGIARALYRQASVLVFDEATSALDNNTEQSVMAAIDGLNRDLTILIIAHRISTVRDCDNIIELEQGRVAAQGSYEQLIACSPSFRQMTELTNDKS